MDKLTQKQRAMLDFIEDHIETFGYSPTIREIAEALGSAAGSTHGMLQRLIEKGYVSKRPDAPRSLTVTGQKSREEELLQRIAELEAELNEYKRRYGA